jgi:hypothetical protein
MLVIEYRRMDLCKTLPATQKGGALDGLSSDFPQLTFPSERYFFFFRNISHFARLLCFESKEFSR